MKSHRWTKNHLAALMAAVCTFKLSLQLKLRSSSILTDTPNVTSSLYQGHGTALLMCHGHYILIYTSVSRPPSGCLYSTTSRAANEAINGSLSAPIKHGDVEYTLWKPFEHSSANCKAQN